MNNPSVKPMDNFVAVHSGEGTRFLPLQHKLWMPAPDSSRLLRPMDPGRVQLVAYRVGSRSEQHSNSHLEHVRREFDALSLLLRRQERPWEETMINSEPYVIFARPTLYGANLDDLYWHPCLKDCLVANEEAVCPNGHEFDVRFVAIPSPAPEERDTVFNAITFEATIDGNRYSVMTQSFRPSNHKTN